MTDGDLADLDGPGGGLAVQRYRARREGWRLGDEVVVARYPAGRLSDAGEYGRRQRAAIDRLLGLLVALTGVGVLLAFVGVASSGASASSNAAGSSPC